MPAILIAALIAHEGGEYLQSGLRGGMVRAARRVRETTQVTFQGGFASVGVGQVDGNTASQALRATLGIRDLDSRALGYAMVDSVEFGIVVVGARVKQLISTYRVPTGSVGIIFNMWAMEPTSRERYAQSGFDIRAAGGGSRAVQQRFNTRADWYLPSALLQAMAAGFHR